MNIVATFEEWLNEQKIFESTKVDDLIAKAKELNQRIQTAPASKSPDANKKLNAMMKELSKLKLSLRKHGVENYEELIAESMIFETQFGSQKVAIFPGRFQPFHLGHIAAFKETSRRFQCPVVPIQILSKTDKSPFPDALLKKMGEAVVKEYDFLAGYVLYPQTLKTVVPQMVKLLREDYDFEAIGMGCGSDRLKSYEPQIKYLNSEKSDVPVSQEFQLEMVDERVPDGPSGTKVREAIANGDQESFEKYMPKSLHKFFPELEKYMK